MRVEYVILSIIATISILGVVLSSPTGLSINGNTLPIPTMQEDLPSDMQEGLEQAQHMHDHKRHHYHQHVHHHHVRHFPHHPRYEE